MVTLAVIVARSLTTATQESVTRMIPALQMLTIVNPRIIAAFYGNTNAMDGAGFWRALPLGKKSHYNHFSGFPYFPWAAWGFGPAECWSERMISKSSMIDSKWDVAILQKRVSRRSVTPVAQERRKTAYHFPKRSDRSRQSEPRGQPNEQH